ncbi:polysaccharide deacetylase family protein [Solimicrobium silvestre]|uniref:polysaccharide deacetylase family protein n=1 Tax=Solimicrobium silvestre TaxID=2099400 RepID=UPI001FB02FAC|nr:polysaccharide deacetylase family protein [Solimicrobium silvestre]
MKADLLTISDEAALQRVRELAREFDAPDLNISHHAQTMSIDELREISSLGVEIANHGWSHLEISHLNHEQVAAHILDGQKWIQQEIGLPAEHYAVPFGTSFVSDAAQVLVRGITMLANSSLPQGELRPGQWNRFELTEELQKP